jgi:hypothetical protein
VAAAPGAALLLGDVLERTHDMQQRPLCSRGVRLPAYSYSCPSSSVATGASTHRRLASQAAPGAHWGARLEAGTSSVRSEDSIATTDMASSAQCMSPAASSAAARGGSTGSRAMRRPISVRPPLLSCTPSSHTPAPVQRQKPHMHPADFACMHAARMAQADFAPLPAERRAWLTRFSARPVAGGQGNQTRAHQPLPQP